ncbi:MAG: DUF418 domain-containing protein, partial [Bacteroidota bacterium]
MSSNFHPIQIKERVEILDLLRGIALLGIFMVNMPLMNAPFVAEMGEFAIWSDSINQKAHWVISFFFSGKFYPLFSMLFGIGFYFFMQKSLETGSSVLPLFRIRLTWLLIIGILHVVLLWYGDILVFYALFGFLMILFRKKSNRSLIIWAICILLIPPFLSSVFALMIQVGMSQPEVAESMMQAFAETEREFHALREQALVVYPTGSFAEIVFMRLQEYRHILGGIFFFYTNVVA